MNVLSEAVKGYFTNWHTDTDSFPQLKKEEDIFIYNLSTFILANALYLDFIPGFNFSGGKQFALHHSQPMAQLEYWETYAHLTQPQRICKLEHPGNLITNCSQINR